MNILQLANKVPYPQKDGGAIATFSLTKSFRDLGHNISLLAMNTNKHYVNINEIPSDFFKGINFFAVNVQAKINPQNAFLNLFFSKLPYNIARFFDENFNDKLIFLLKNNQFDIIQLEGLPLALYIPTIKKYSNALISMRSHNVEHEIWERCLVQESNFIKKNYLKILTKRIKKFDLKYLNFYDLLLPITQRDADVFIKWNCKVPIFVTPTGIDIKNLKADFNKIEYPSIFHLGALDWLPNQEGLMWFIKNIWHRIVEKNPNVKFYIAGRNAPKSLKNKLKGENIIFLGEIENAQDFMNSKAIMIVPLLSGSGMRIKIIEGMALGKTIITTSIGTEGINTNHEKNILIANNIDDFVFEIQKVLNNFDFFKEIGKNAIHFIENNFDNIAIAKKLIEFYQIFLDKKSYK